MLAIAPSFYAASMPTNGLNVWLKADAIAGLTNGDFVSSWDDSSGNGNHATNSTAIKQPTYRTNVVNDLPAVRFNESSAMTNWLQNLTYVHGTSNGTQVVVTKRNGAGYAGD